MWKYTEKRDPCKNTIPPLLPNSILVTIFQHFALKNYFGSSSKKENYFVLKLSCNNGRDISLITWLFTCPRIKNQTVPTIYGVTFSERIFANK